MLGCLAAVGSAIPTTAAANVTSLTNCQSISAPGKYRLDADVTAPANPFTTCFFIADTSPSDAPVTLDLNGHTITAPGSHLAGTTGIGSAFVSPTGPPVNIVGPGTVTGFQDGIILNNVGGNVRGVTVTGNGVGISVDMPVNDVRGNVATDNSVGIVTSPCGCSLGPPGDTIIGNYAHNNNQIDLADENAITPDGGVNCDDGNVWRGNDFGTAFPGRDCIH
jgi:hypothetical protein